MQMELHMNTEKLLSLKLIDVDEGQVFYVTIIYSCADRNTRITLWDDLYDIALNLVLSWLVGETLM